MRILITGASGFIGQALSRALDERGLEWRGVTRREIGSIGPQADWSRALSGCDRVVHLANMAHIGSAAESEVHAVNVEGTRRLAEQAVGAGARRFLYVSSTKVVESDDTYGRAKLAAEQALRAIPGLEVVVLRPPLVYGSGVKANFLALMRAVDRGWPLPLGSVRNRRSLVYLGNLVDAIVRCLQAPEAAGKTYFVTDGKPVSTPDLVRAIARALDRPARLLPFPPTVLDWIPPLRRLTRSLEVDDSAIRSELGWKPPYTFEEGLRLTAEWYLAQRG
jgi:nucleoside-diphosphate-sugar epimerase